MWGVALFANTALAAFAGYILCRENGYSIGYCIRASILMWCLAPGVWIFCLMVASIVGSVLVGGSRGDVLQVVMPAVISWPVFLLCIAGVWCWIYRRALGQ